MWEKHIDWFASCTSPDQGRSQPAPCVPMSPAGYWTSPSTAPPTTSQQPFWTSHVYPGLQCPLLLPWSWHQDFRVVMFRLWSLSLHRIRLEPTSHHLQKPSGAPHCHSELFLSSKAKPHDPISKNVLIAKAGGVSFSEIWSLGPIYHGSCTGISFALKAIHNLVILPATSLPCQVSSPATLQWASLAWAVDPTSPCLQCPSLSFALGWLSLLLQPGAFFSLCCFLRPFSCESHWAFGKLKLEFYRICSFQTGLAVEPALGRHLITTGWW